ncbi:restriction endonuclease subunit S [Leyella stercorea]|jgi:type I restriction enzyme, S subunit|uniref:restriction endonuclease subunit S n=1 Tax=Leyella stercorea TaxID=363265 RepID=UPI003F81F5E8
MNTKALRQKILDLAIHGKLVPQDPNDEPASVLLERIRDEKERLIKEGKIKRPKKTKTTSDKPHYENVLPEGWTITTLGEIFQHNNGKQKSSSNKEGRLLKYITTSNVYWGEFDLSNVKEMFFTNNELEKCTVTKGDLLVCEGGDVGRSAIWNYEYPICIQNHLHRLRSWLPVCNEYFFYSLMYNKFKNLIKGKGIGLMSLSSNDLHNIPINLPPVNEQKRIVAEINRWFDLFKSIENNTDNLNTLIKTTKSKVLDLAIHGKLVPQDPTDEPATELLKRINPNAEITSDNGHYQKWPEGWCETQLGDIFNHNTGKALNSSNTEGTLKDYLTTSNVYWNSFDFSVIKKMFFKESELNKCQITKGDLLVCEGGDIGRAAIWDYDYDICIQNHLHRLRPKVNGICVSFYYYVLYYLKINNMIGGKGIGLLGLSSNALHKLHVPFPPLNEQHRIVAKIEEIFAQLDAIEASL